MSYTQTELDALRQAYANGVLSVEYEGKTVRYGDAADLKLRLDTLERSLSRQAGTPTTRRIGIYAGKGLT